MWYNFYACRLSLKFGQSANMNKKCRRMSVAIVAVLLALNASAFVLPQFFAPMPQMPSQDQMIRQFAAAQGLDVNDVPAGQMTKELLFERMAAKLKRESGPRADAVVQQYALPEADFSAALRRANTPEELLSLRTELFQRICQIANGCSQVGCSNQDAVERTKPTMGQVSRVLKKVEQLSSEDRARYEALDKALQERMQAQNDALRAINSQIMNNLIQQTSQPLAFQNSSSGENYGSSRRKSFKSVGNCPLHGSYDMATGCPGCKGNVDFGSGKQMHCSKHNLNFDSSLGCPLCNRIGDEGRFAPTWR